MKTQISDTIRDALARVAQIRQTAASVDGLQLAISEIKQFQAGRFSRTYADLLETARYRPAALFFLDELYGTRDFSERDRQFSRIAGSLERIFPEPVVQTALLLATLHLLTEELDLAIAQYWMKSHGDSEAVRYISAWRAVGRRVDRDRQLRSVVQLGQELTRLTGTPGLRIMLRMMRTPAALAGLAALQQFLELGFDTFATMGHRDNGPTHFLAIIQTRECALLECLFESRISACETELSRVFTQAK